MCSVTFEGRVVIGGFSKKNTVEIAQLLATQPRQTTLLQTIYPKKSRPLVQRKYCGGCVFDNPIWGNSGAEYGLNVMCVCLITDLKWVTPEREYSPLFVCCVREHTLSVKRAETNKKKKVSTDDNEQRE